ncbi:MAG: IS3 family transposase [Bacteroidales bacterium]|nr:IS3 family transposase [Bacteroidales bacterium]
MRHYPVTSLCALAGVTRQAFYKRDEDFLFRRLAIEQFVVQFARGVREQDPGIGADNLWRIYRERFSEEYRVGRDAFRDILHEHGLNIRRRFRAPRTTDSRHSLPTYPNLVKNVIPTRPNQIWVSDITYIAIEDSEARLGYTFCFLTIIMDAYSKKILGWRVAPTLEAAHSIKALKMAIKTLPEGFSETLIHHSDRGTQYASADYIKVLADNNITPSMTESGNPKDNAMAERINSTVKNELLYGKTFSSLRQVFEAVRKAVEFYNSERPHSSIDWHTPDEAHQMQGEMKRHWHSWREDAIKKQAMEAV